MSRRSSSARSIATSSSSPGFRELAERNKSTLDDDGVCLERRRQDRRAGRQRSARRIECGLRVPRKIRRHSAGRNRDENMCRSCRFAEACSSITLTTRHSPIAAYHCCTGPAATSSIIQIIDWLAKNRLNSLQFSCEIYDQVRPKILDSILDRGLTMKIGGHSRKYFYPSEKYFPQSSRALRPRQRKADGRHPALLLESRFGRRVCQQYHRVLERRVPRSASSACGRPMATDFASATTARRGRRPTFCWTTSTTLRSESTQQLAAGEGGVSFVHPLHRAAGKGEAAAVRRANLLRILVPKPIPSDHRRPGSRTPSAAASSNSG